MIERDILSDNEANAGETNGWGKKLILSVCENCEWSFYTSPDLENILCQYCYHSFLQKVSDWAPDKIQEAPPEMVIPFSIIQDTLEGSVKQFSKGIPFAPKDLSHQHIQARLHRLFLPMWMVDTQVEAKWWAEVGFNYLVVSHQSAYAQNVDEWSTTEIKENRVRWESRLGTLKRGYHNVTTAALDEDEGIKKSMGGFMLEQARSYSPDLIEDAAIRLPNRDINDAWIQVQPTLHSLAGDECRQAADADHIRQFRWKPEYGDQNWTLLLLPLYSTYYLDDDKVPQPVYIHGQTGEIKGARRASMRRAIRASLVGLIAAILLFLVSLGISAASLALPFLIIVGIIIFVAAILVGIASFIPVILAWNFNRSGRTNRIIE